PIFLFLISSINTMAQDISLEWAADIGSQSGSTPSITIDTEGNTYISGTFNGTIDFDPGLGVYNLTSPIAEGGMYIVKLNSTGNLVWAKAFLPTGFNVTAFMNAIAVDSDGNVYTTSSYSGLWDFNPGSGVYTLPNPGILVTGGAARNTFIAKLNSNGNFVWAKHFNGGASVNQGVSIAVDNGGNVYT